MSTSRVRCIILTFTSCILDRRVCRLGSDVHPRWQRDYEVLDLGSDLAQFHSARGRSSRQILVVPPFVGHTVRHHRRLREYHLSRPDRYNAFGRVVALRNLDAYAALFADTR